MIKYYLLILFIISLINGCTSIDSSTSETTSTEKKIPVVERSAEPEPIIPAKAIAQQPKVITIAAASPALTRKAKKKSAPPSRQAVLELLAQSKSAIDQYNYHEAESLLSRALRIEPDNAWLWHNMAVLKFYQQDYQQAIQQALKSNNLQKNSPQLKNNNKKIIKQSTIEINR